MKITIKFVIVTDYLIIKLSDLFVKKIESVQHLDTNLG